MSGTEMETFYMLCKWQKPRFPMLRLNFKSWITLPCRTRKEWQGLLLVFGAKCFKSDCGNFHSVESVFGPLDWSAWLLSQWGQTFKSLLCPLVERPVEITWNMYGGLCALPPRLPWASRTVPECHQKEGLVNKFFIARKLWKGLPYMKINLTAHNY